MDANTLTLSHFHTVNDKRARTVFGNHWTPLEWCAALAGECGELCNFVKKMKRIDDRLAALNINLHTISFLELSPDADAEAEDRYLRQKGIDLVISAGLPAQQGMQVSDEVGEWVRHRRGAIKEMADVFTYLDLVSSALGNGPLGQAVIDKFNEVSARRNTDITL